MVLSPVAVGLLGILFEKFILRRFYTADDPGPAGDLRAGDDRRATDPDHLRAIAAPPFLAFPLVGAVAYTFGGLATDDRARVLRDGAPIPGLYAAGEITGHFYATAPNAVSVLRTFVFGRIAGREAAALVGAATAS